MSHSTTCCDCGAGINFLFPAKKGGRRPMRCERCRDEKAREQRRESARRSDARKKAARVDYICLRCRKPSTVKRREGKLPKWCPECRDIVRKERAEAARLKKEMKVWPNCSCGNITMEASGVCLVCQKANAMWDPAMTVVGR